MFVYPIPKPHALRHPLTGELVVPKPGEPHDADDPLVKAFPWCFVGAEGLDAAHLADQTVETAVKVPGAKRATKRA